MASAQSPHSPTLSPPQSPNALPLRSPPLPEAPKESAVARLLIVPLTFISFLLSLSLISTRNASLRSSTPPTTTLGHIKAFLHSIIFAPQPYAYVKSPAGVSSVSSPAKSPAGDGSPKSPRGVKGKGEEEPWHWHTKQRKLMKMEMDDAFRVRKRVALGLLIFLLLAGWGFMRVGRWIWVKGGYALFERVYRGYYP